jgi:hypothetical protein
MSIVFGYLDAGTGSMVLQAAAGAFVALLVFVKGFGRKIMAFFGRKKIEQEKLVPAKTKNTSKTSKSK